jgi:hypothetical protein
MSDITQRLCAEFRAAIFNLDAFIRGGMVVTDPYDLYPTEIYHVLAGPGNVGRLLDEIDALREHLKAADAECAANFIRAREWAERAGAMEGERDAAQQLAADRLVQMEVDRRQALVWRDDAAKWQSLYRRAINEANGLTNYLDDRPALHRAERNLAAIEAEARAAIAAARAAEVTK